MDSRSGLFILKFSLILFDSFGGCKLTLQPQHLGQEWNASEKGGRMPHMDAGSSQCLQQVPPESPFTPGWFLPIHPWPAPCLGLQSTPSHVTENKPSVLHPSASPRVPFSSWVLFPCFPSLCSALQLDVDPTSPLEVGNKHSSSYLTAFDL